MEHMDETNVMVAGEVKSVEELHETMTMENIFDIAEQATLEVYNQQDVTRALKYEDIHLRLATLVRDEMDPLMLDGDDIEYYYEWVVRFKQAWSDINLLLAERQKRIQQYEADLTNLAQSSDKEFLAKRMMRMIGRLTLDDLRQKRIELAQHKELREHVSTILENDMLSDPTFVELFLEELNKTTEAIEKETTK